MSEKIAIKFAEALEKLETQREIEPIVQLFAENCKVGNTVSPEKFQGRIGAREFWGEIYRETFGEVKSGFRNILSDENMIVLEWITEGTSRKGEKLRYEGVSILEVEADLIIRFRAYFDSAALAHQIEK